MERGIYYKQRRSVAKPIFATLGVIVLLYGVSMGSMFVTNSYYSVDGEPSSIRKSGGVYRVYALPQDLTEEVIPEKSPEEIRKETVDKLNSKLGGKLKNRGEDFVRFSEERNMDPYLMAAISIHETGNGTSKAIMNKNNVGGIMNNGVYLKSFISITSGIEHMIHLLATEYFQGRNHRTIADIGAVYCPVGATNDPTNLNKHWVPRVTELYREFTGGDFVYKEG